MKKPKSILDPTRCKYVLVKDKNSLLGRRQCKRKRRKVILFCWQHGLLRKK